jgi:ATP-dependent RNA helicase DHX37/DHR1
MAPSSKSLLGDDFAGAAGELAREELGRNVSDSNQLLLTKEEQARCRRQAKAEAARAAAAEAAEAKARTPQSKALRKKLEQIAAKKRKAEERAAVLATLSTHRVDATQRALMRTSGTMGQDLTKRQRLQRALHAKAADIELDNMEDIEVPRESFAEAEDRSASGGVPVAFASVRGVAGWGGAAADTTGDGDKDDGDKDDAYWAAQAMGFGPAVDYMAGARPKAKASRATLDAAARVHWGRRAPSEQVGAPGAVQENLWVAGAAAQQVGASGAVGAAGKEAAAASKEANEGQGAGEEEEAAPLEAERGGGKFAEAAREEWSGGDEPHLRSSIASESEKMDLDDEMAEAAGEEGYNDEDHDAPSNLSPSALPEREGLDLEEEDMEVGMIEALRGVLRHTPHLLPKLDLAEGMRPNGKKQRAALFAIWGGLSDLQRREMDALADSGEEDGLEEGSLQQRGHAASGEGRVRGSGAGSAVQARHGAESSVQGGQEASGGGRVRAGAEGSVERSGLSQLARSIVDLMDGAGDDTATVGEGTPAAGGRKATAGGGTPWAGSDRAFWRGDMDIAGDDTPPSGGDMAAAGGRKATAGDRAATAGGRRLAAGGDTAAPEQTGVRDAQALTRAEAGARATAAPSEPAAALSAAAVPAAAPAAVSKAMSARSAVASGPCSRTGAFYVPVNRTEAVSRAREQLPIFGEEQRVMEAVSESDVILLCGETGSGKTTQVCMFYLPTLYPLSTIPHYSPSYS